MSNLSQAKEERQRKALQREILRAQSNAQTRSGSSGSKRDWGSIILLVVIFILIVIAAVLFWIIATGRMRLPTVDTMSPPVQQTAGDTNPQMDNVYQDPTLKPSIKLDANYLEETVFLGDSNTVRLRMYEYVEEEQCLAQDSIGIGAVTYLRLSGSNSSGYSENYGRTMLESLSVMQPKRILMTFGTNDIGGYSAEDFVEMYGTAIAAIREVSDCDIIVNSIFPARQGNAYPNLQKGTIEEFNAALEEMCKQEGIPFLNSYEVLVGEDGWCKPEYTIEDGVHLNDTGIETFLDYYRTHIYVAGESE